MREHGYKMAGVEAPTIHRCLTEKPRIWWVPAKGHRGYTHTPGHWCFGQRIGDGGIVWEQAETFAEILAVARRYVPSPVVARPTLRQHIARFFGIGHD